MLRTLVYLNADLASSIALRYTCQLAQVVDMKLHSIHVEEPDQGTHAPGTGWVRRTWESALLKAGELEIAQLINAEKSSCPMLSAPKMLIGDRENEILSEIQSESYDLFVEGELYSFNAKKLYDKISGQRNYHKRLLEIIHEVSVSELEGREVIELIDDKVNEVLDYFKRRYESVDELLNDVFTTVVLIITMVSTAK